MASIRVVPIDRKQGHVANDSIFVGTVEIQELVNEAAAALLRVTAVTFLDGAKNRPHRHTTDQVLVATGGSGFLATAERCLSLNTGDVALIPAGTRHWHGAQPGETFTHLSILTPGHITIEDEEPGENG